MMDLNVSIRSLVPWIVKHYAFNEASCAESKKVLTDLIVEMETKATQRLYLMYYLVEEMMPLGEDEANAFFSTLLPIPLPRNVAKFLSQLVSLAISLENKQILTALSQYIEKEVISLPNDIQNLPPSLANVSPRFTTVLIDKGYFNTVKDVVTPELLTQWIQAISSSDNSLTFSGQSVIRYSSIGDGVNHTELHLVLLQCIERRKIAHLSNQFIIDIAVNLKNKPDNYKLLERFSQILIVAIQSGICPKFSNQANKTLLSLFPNHSLIQTLLLTATKKS